MKKEDLFVSKNKQKIVIQPDRHLSLEFQELWNYRELLYFLTWRDIKVRYKQTLIGIGWAVLQPFFSMIVFTIFFGKMAKIPSERLPYPIFSYSGLILWTYFANAVSMASNSLVGQANLISKIYFPRLFIPLSSILGGLLDYFIALVILILMMLWYHFTPRLTIFFLPFIILLSFLATAGIGIWLSAINVKYRDVRYAIPFLIQIWLFITPVIYPASILPERFSWLLSLNPMSGIIEAHRVLILAHQSINWIQLSISTAVTVVLFVAGVFYFKQTERSFADII